MTKSEADEIEAQKTQKMEAISERDGEEDDQPSASDGLLPTPVFSYAKFDSAPDNAKRLNPIAIDWLTKLESSLRGKDSE